MPATLPYLLHWSGLVAVAVLFMHVQVTTRFVAACPAVDWALAQARLEAPPARHACTARAAPAGAGAAAGGSRVRRLLGGALALVADVRVRLLAYCVGYTALGAALFTNFYDWT